MTVAISTFLAAAYALFLILVAYGIEQLAGKAANPEGGQFHRVIACTVATLAVLFPLATAAAAHQWRDVVVLLMIGALALFACMPLAVRLRRGTT